MLSLEKKLKIKRAKNGVTKNGEPYSIITVSDALKDRDGNTTWQNVQFWSNTDFHAEEGDYVILTATVFDANDNEKTDMQVERAKVDLPELPF